MNRTIVAMTYTALLALASPAQAELFLLADTLHLRDGTLLEGTIVEQSPGESLILENFTGERRTVNIEEIASMEKRSLDERYAYSFRDVVYLTDGVIFRGIVVEQVPGDSLLLETENGLLLRFAEGEIWKIAKDTEERLEAAGGPKKPRLSDRLKVELEIQLVQEEAQTKEGTDAAEEVDRLKDELETLAAERDRAAEEIVQEEERRSANREEFEPLRRELTAILSEVDAAASSCDAPGLRNEIEAKAAILSSIASELIARIEQAALIEPPRDPRLDRIAAERAVSEASALVANDLWLKKGYAGELQQAVSGLDFKQRQTIYRETRKKDQFQAMGRNTIPFLSWGSWKQGDYLGASIGSMVMIAGASLISMGISEGLLAATPRLDLGATGPIGIGVLATGYIFSLLEPLWYVHRYNRRLYNVLMQPQGGGQ